MTCTKYFGVGVPIFFLIRLLIKCVTMILIQLGVPMHQNHSKTFSLNMPGTLESQSRNKSREKGQTVLKISQKDEQTNIHNNQWIHRDVREGAATEKLICPGW